MARSRCVLRANSRISVLFPIRRRPRHVTSDGVFFRRRAARPSSYASRPKNMASSLASVRFVPDLSPRNMARNRLHVNFVPEFGSDSWAPNRRKPRFSCHRLRLSGTRGWTRGQRRRRRGRFRDGVLGTLSAILFQSAGMGRGNVQGCLMCCSRSKTRYDVWSARRREPGTGVTKRVRRGYMSIRRQES